MTVAVEQDVWPGLVLPDDAEVAGGIELGKELVDHVGLARDGRHVFIVRQEVAVLVA